MGLFRAFSLLEVIIALSISVLGIALGYEIIGIVTERLKRMTYEENITYITNVNGLYLSILKSSPEIKGKGVTKGSLVFKHCTNLEVNRVSFKVCEYYRKHPYVDKYLPAGVYYAPELDLLFSR